MGQQAEAEERDDEDLNLDDQDQGNPPEDQDDDQGDGDADDQDQNQGEGDDADDEEEDEITFGDEAAPASKGDDSGLVKQLRAEIRKRDQRIAELQTGAKPQKVEVGPKPKLDDFYDQDDPEAAFEEALDSWKERKRQADEVEAEAKKRDEAINAKFAEKVASFGRQKAALKVKDFSEVEEIVAASLSQVQAAVILKAAENSAALIYALGKHPQKLATLAAIEDPFEFAATVARMEGTLKVSKRTRTPPEPDRPERGSAPLADKTDRELERLEKEAARTGDRTKVVAYKRRMKAQGRA